MSGKMQKDEQPQENRREGVAYYALAAPAQNDLPRILERWPLGRLLS
jgi:hypothetical protein